jgi:hypothetical protein
MRPYQLALALSIALPSVTLAQSNAGSASPVQIGSRIRILSPVLGDKAQTATALSVLADTLVFRRQAGGSEALSGDAITHLDISTGMRAHKAKGALIGFVTGVAAGGILGYATYKKPKCGTGEWCIGVMDFGQSGSAAFGAGLVGLVGLGVGAIVGAHETETWTPVSLR